MANGNLIRALRKIVEGEHLAANGLAVAASKAKDLDLQKILSDLSSKHETNAVAAGTKLKELGGKYPVPGLRDTLKKGWEAVATTRNTADSIKFIQQKERESVEGYRNILKKVKDERMLGLVARNLADNSDNLNALGDKLKQLKGKKKGKSFLGLPKLIWVTAIGAAIGIIVKRRLSSEPSQS